MPPPPEPAAQVLKIRLIGDMQEGLSKWNCIFHAKYSGSAPNNPALVTMNGQIITLFNANLAPLCSTDVRLTEVHSTDLTSNTAAQAATEGTSLGTRVGTSMMAQVAMVGSWLIQARWRGGHCRNYWPFGVINDRSNVSTWNAAFITAATNGLAAFLGGINSTVVSGAPLSMVCLSRFTNVPVRGTRRVPPVPFTITGIVVHPRVDTQRRRLGKERA